MEQDDAVPQDQVADAGENADVKTEPSDCDKSATTNVNRAVTEAAAAEAASKAAAAAVAAATAMVKPSTTTTTPELPDSGTKTKRWTWKKPAGKPKRPLSAYNLFFADVRKDLMDEQAKDPSKPKLGFTELALHVSEKWKNIEAGRKEEYERLARDAKGKYHVEIAKWKEVTANGTIRVGVDQDGRYLEQPVAAAVATIDTPAPTIPQVARCATCPACMALSAEQGLPEPNPIYIVASKEYVSQLLANPTAQQSARGVSAADLAGEAIDEKAEVQEEKKPTASDDTSKDVTPAELPTISLSVMPDGSIFHTRSDMRTLNQAKLQQDVTSLWTQVRQTKEELRTKAASSARHVPL